MRRRRRRSRRRKTNCEGVGARVKFKRRDERRKRDDKK